MIENEKVGIEIGLTNLVVYDSTFYKDSSTIYPEDSFHRETLT